MLRRRKQANVGDERSMYKELQMLTRLRSIILQTSRQGSMAILVSHAKQAYDVGTRG